MQVWILNKVERLVQLGLILWFLTLFPPSSTRNKYKLYIGNGTWPSFGWPYKRQWLFDLVEITDELKKWDKNTENGIKNESDLDKFILETVTKKLKF